MGKVISIPQPIPKEALPEEGAKATVINARIIRDQFTSIGTCKLGLGLTVDVMGDEYSAMFSLDKPLLTGSIGRILADAGLTEVGPDITDEDVKSLIGKTYDLKVKQGKLYWYP